MRLRPSSCHDTWGVPETFWHHTLCLLSFITWNLLLRTIFKKIFKGNNYSLSSNRKKKSHTNRYLERVKWRTIASILGNKPRSEMFWFCFMKITWTSAIYKSSLKGLEAFNDHVLSSLRLFFNNGAKQTNLLLTFSMPVIHSTKTTSSTELT